MRHFISQISLMHGWLPATVQAIAAALVVAAIGWRSRSIRWRTVWLPSMVIAALVVAFAVRWYVDSLGLAGQPGPHVLWIWIQLTALAVGLLVVGWPGAQWWRRGVAVLAVPLCLLSASLVLNGWVGYFPTVRTAWDQLSAAPLPNQVDRLAVTAMQLRHERPTKGVVVSVNIDSDVSTFSHRGEFVYLPPAWFATNPPPKLPTVMMISSELNTPADWIRVGNAVITADGFAATHGGNAPVLAFVDPTGSFTNDTECVNSSRGNVADYLTRDVVPYMVSNFGVRPDREGWGVVGWSMGGTCAVDLAVMHPELFSAFVDIAGDIGPNTGDKEQTIERLYGGDADAWLAFDPISVMTRHGPYTGMSGWFEIPGNEGDSAGDKSANPEGQDVAAQSLCAVAGVNGIDCAVVRHPGRHDWQFASMAFWYSFPWLAGQLQTPQYPRIPLPGARPSEPGPEPPRPPSTR